MKADDIPVLDEEILRSMNPESAVEARVGALLAEYERSNRLTSTDEIKIEAVRKGLSSSLLRHVGGGAAVGFLAGTPFPPRLRMPARVFGCSVGIILGIKFAFKSNKDNALRSLADLRTPLGRDLRGLFSQYCPQHPALVGVSMSDVREGNDNFEDTGDSDSFNSQFDQTSDIPGETTTSSPEFGDDNSISPSWEREFYEPEESTRKHHVRRNQWGDVVEED